MDPSAFHRIGRTSAADLLAALQTIGRSFSTFGHVLDFGCGCGRTLLWLRDQGPRLYGCDLHADCIAWCQTSLEFAAFRTNRVRPPLDFADGTFDLIYGISVFTHLDEQDQFDWLQELQRVTTRGAVVLLSVHGRPAWRGLAPAEVVKLEHDGILVKEAHALWGVFAKYFNTFHDERYIRERWSEFFNVRGYLDRRLNNHQDLVVLERR